MPPATLNSPPPAEPGFGRALQRALFFRWPRARHSQAILEVHGHAECNTEHPARNRRGRPWGWILSAICGPLLAQAAQAQLTAPPAFTNALALAQQAHQKAVNAYNQNRNDPELAWQAGRACFDLAEFVERKADRATLAEEGIQACRQAVSLQSNSAPAHYYLAMNLGQLMRGKGWGGIRYLGQLRREFETAAALDPRLDFAGPERNLGNLFRNTPEFAGGDRQEAQKHLERAVQLEPDYPENRLALMEGLVKWGEHDAAREQLRELESLWSKARARFSGPQYEPAWADWEERLRHAKRRLK